MYRFDIKMQYTNNQLKANSFAFVLVYFLYSVVVFPGLFIGQGPATILLSVLTILPILFLNFRMGFNTGTKRVLLFEFLLFTLLLLEILLYPRYIVPILEAFTSLLTIGTIGLIAATLETDLKLCYKYGNYLAVFGLLSSIMLIFTMSGEDLFAASMRFAYAILPSVLWFLLMYFYQGRKTYLIAFLLSFAPMLVWGSRGATVCIFLFLLLYILKNKPQLIFLLILFVIIFTFDIKQILVELFTWLEAVTGSDKIGDFADLFAGEEEARDKIYDYCRFKISQNILGYGVGWWMYDSNMYGMFPHNVILHLGTEFGIFGLLFFLILSVSSIRLVFVSTKEKSLLYMYFISICMGRLMVSSTYWDRPEFWFLIGISFFRRKL